MLRVERKWNLTKYKIITREDGKKKKGKNELSKVKVTHTATAKEHHSVKDKHFKRN